MFRNSRCFLRIRTCRKIFRLFLTFEKINRNHDSTQRLATTVSYQIHIVLDISTVNESSPSPCILPPRNPHLARQHHPPPLPPRFSPTPAEQEHPFSTLLRKTTSCGAQDREQEPLQWRAPLVRLRRAKLLPAREQQGRRLLAPGQRGERVWHRHLRRPDPADRVGVRPIQHTSSGRG